MRPLLNKSLKNKQTFILFLENSNHYISVVQLYLLYAPMEQESALPERFPWPSEWRWHYRSTDFLHSSAAALET
jgi:hypothetical protein